MEVGQRIRQAREELGLSQAGLAARAGLSAPLVSSLETGRRRPHLDTVARLLAAMGLQVHIELEPLWADVDAAIDAARGQPLEHRMRQWKVDLSSLVQRLDGVPFTIDGVAAAALQGAPVPVHSADVIVSSTQDALDRLTHVLVMDLFASRWNRQRRGWGGIHPDPRESGELRYISGPTGEFRIHLTDRVEPDLHVEVDGSQIPVVALARVEVSGGWTERVLARMRERIAAGPASVR